MPLCKMANVDAAEKEASEVLHSLLSVERIVKQEVSINHDQAQHTASNNNQLSTSCNQQNGSAQVADASVGTTDINNTDNNIAWQGNVAITTHSLFEDHFPPTIDEQQVHDVVWQGHTIQVETNELNLYTDNPSPIVEESDEKDIKLPEILRTNNTKVKVSAKKTKLKTANNSNNVSANQKKVKKKKRKDNTFFNWDPTKLEDNASQVKERFKRGCECQDESCFRGLSPESVYKHRLNIAELTKGEHDMYLMGVTMACLANPDITVRHKERQRLRAQYVYQGRRVCLDAFLYLENCTHYQLKRIRKHVMTHGVAPRVHGNHGKKPHNTFSLDIYQHATEFLKQYLETHTGETNVNNSKNAIQLPWDITRKNLHNAYKEYGQLLEPGVKLMGYSTFRHFLKEQFPHVRFCKVEPKNSSVQQISVSATNSANQSVEIVLQSSGADQLKIQATNQTIIEHQQPQRSTVDQTHVHKSVISGSEVQQVIPLVVSQSTSDTSQHHHHQQATFLVAPVSQLLPNGSNLVTMQNPTGHTTNTFPYQITNTGYVINEQGNIVANQPQYTFNRM